MPLYREDLEALCCRCGAPDCPETARYLHAACHISSGLEVRYEKGVLDVNCLKCKKNIARIHVASQETEEKAAKIDALHEEAIRAAAAINMGPPGDRHPPENHADPGPCFFQQ